MKQTSPQTNNNTSSLSSYDIISVLPTTQASFSLACLTHSVPGTLTAHIISLDLSSQPRLPFYLKHTLIRTAIRNGAVFEIPYAPAVSANDEHKRRNWWANAREVARDTHGKNILLSGGGQAVADLRAPLDVANMLS
jgi:ribonuclease P/MRP protein subunit RPP1